MKNPFFKIGVALSLIFVIAWIILWVKSGDPRSVLLLFIGALVGPYMGLSFPFGLTFKVGYSIALFLSFAGFIAGVTFRKRIWGQALTVLAVVGWFLCGLIGLGTGT